MPAPDASPNKSPRTYEGATLNYITTSDNVQLAVHRIGPEFGPTVLLVPGTFSNATFWLGTRATGFARYLAERGYDVWVLEPRGHGGSARPDAKQRWDFDDWARRDVPAAIQASTSHEKHVVLIGHSAGGAAIVAALAGDLALQQRVRGVITICTPLPWMQLLRGMAARGIRALSRTLRWFPARALRLGPEDELAGVMAQWMTWNIDARWIGDDGTDYAARFRELTIPMLMIAGEGDRMWAPPKACHGLFDLAGARDKTFLVCGTKTGFTRDFGHVDVLVGQAAQDETWPLIRNWLSALR